jgi:DNA-binding transcriptional regulator YiaG
VITIVRFFTISFVFRQFGYAKRMTPAQCRAARGLLDFKQDELARAAGVSVVTVRNFERGKSTLQRASLEVIRRALQAAGVEFIPENGGGAGVRLTKD